MKYKVTISQEIIYETTVISDDEESAIEIAGKIFEKNPDHYQEVYSEFEAIDIKEVR